MIVVFWAPSFFLLGTIDTWQLIINTVTTVVTFLLVALPQNTQKRSDGPLQVKFFGALPQFFDCPFFVRRRIAPTLTHARSSPIGCCVGYSCRLLFRIPLRAQFFVEVLILELRLRVLASHWCVLALRLRIRSIRSRAGATRGAGDQNQAREQQHVTASHESNRVWSRWRRARPYLRAVRAEGSR